MDQRVSLITLAVHDIDRAAAFYAALGWAEVQHLNEGIVVFDLLGQSLGLYPRAKLAEDMGLREAELGHGAMTLSHNVESPAAADAIMAKAEAAGATVLSPAKEVFWGGYTGYFRDPEGHVWEVSHNPFSKLSPEGAFRWNGY
ncbi:putative enzyme related to lactoylglutathione lyase [Tritonibacter multivorans]|uniref:Putative enzyme related to lactoylglutathione lyase n=1 Tax=Tritonibacter multivorans TaxID=928856 RepID=A0A0P1GHM4_9RHOB|nr:VOC family protein [Tritonibacter multivorans]MDA7420650.1 VOC family protein [Tritonibacter multivorans]CUH81199.1 putative enzyme related to lactoylglutathione lyase [Tritonibacter multivorans]SFC30616.1 hypothetical protein SAMN04488049_102126 [Tritonibacter multivorans]